MKNVTIRELKAAAKRKGLSDPHVYLYRSKIRQVLWFAAVFDQASDMLEVSVRWHSRQGAMRMALAALRAK